MNKQKKVLKDGSISRGIEWTDFTWNAIGGCKHGCRWHMPDGSTAICYAEEVATKVAQAFYPQGFEHHYFKPDKLGEPLRLKNPAKIFCDSMSDLWGHWIPETEHEMVLEVMRKASWHTFQSLTKAPARMLMYQKAGYEIPANMWAGASVPPSVFMGKELSQHQQERMLHRTLEVLAQLRVPIRWLSIEPLSFDVSAILAEHPGAIQWAVIGAASNGKKLYQPKPEWVANTLRVLDAQGVAVFFKGNLQWAEWREEFPGAREVKQGQLL
jgi:protein gp37